MGLIGAMAKTRCGDRADRAQTERIRQKRLEALVRYARENSPYYRALYAGVGDRFRLDELPPTSKPEMMAHFDDFLTDRNVTMAEIEAFTADPDNIGRMLDGKYLVFQTSGSTGHPAVVLYDKGMIDVSSAVAAFRTFARKEDCRAFMKHYMPIDFFGGEDALAARQELDRQKRQLCEANGVRLIEWPYSCEPTDKNVREALAHETKKDGLSH